MGLKFRVKFKKMQIRVKSRLNRHEEVNNRELLVFNTKLIRGLMIPKVLKSRVIEYSSQGDMSLKSFLNREIGKNEFFLIIAQIVETVKSVEKHGFNINNLIFNMKYVFVDSNTSAVSFIYQPVIGDNISSGIYSFISDIVFHIKPKKEEDHTYLKDFSKFLSETHLISVSEIGNYIMRNHSQVYKQLKHQGVVVEQKKKTEDNEETALLVEEDTSLLDDEGTSFLYDDEGTSVLSDDEGTSVLSDDDYDGTKLFKEKTINYPYLIKLSTYDRIDINKPVFRMGKEKSYVDCFISNNNAVSRLHADIITQGLNYFIRDNNSTNRTFVNGIAIAPDRDFQIFDGDQLTLANEAFEFHII